MIKPNVLVRHVNLQKIDPNIENERFIISYFCQINRHR